MTFTIELQFKETYEVGASPRRGLSEFVRPGAGSALAKHLMERQQETPANQRTVRRSIEVRNCPPGIRADQAWALAQAYLDEGLGFPVQSSPGGPGGAMMVWVEWPFLVRIAKAHGLELEP